MPFNIYSIDDIDEWRNQFIFPISLDVGERIEKNICEFLISEYRRFHPDFKIHFRIASKTLFLELYDLLMKFAMAFRMRSHEEIDFVHTNHRCPEDAILPSRCESFQIYEGNYDIEFRNLRLVYDDQYYLNISPWEKIAKRIYNIFELPPHAKSDDNRPYLIVPNACSLKYARIYFKKRPFLIRPELVFNIGNGNNTSFHIEKAFDNFSERAVEFTRALFWDICNEELPAILLETLRLAILNQFNRISSDLGQARKYCERLPKNIHLFTSTAKHYIRTISEVIRERGGRVTGFPHEGGLSGLVLPSLVFTEFATCDEFICFDEKDAHDYKKYDKINDVQFPVAAELGESPLNIEANRFKTRQSIDLTKVKAIMYVAYGAHYDNYGSATRCDIQGIDLQFRILEYLIGLGKKVVFKNRPKTAYLSDQFDHFGYFNDRVEYTATPFTDVLEEADLFIFEVISSASIYEAMTLTKKPIILFKTKIPRCTPEFEKMLNKRCYVVDLYEDERNRLNFNAEILNRIFGLNYEN